MNESLIIKLMHAGISTSATEALLARLNRAPGSSSTVRAGASYTIPSFDGKRIIDGRPRTLAYSISQQQAVARLSHLIPSVDWTALVPGSGSLNADQLSAIGKKLLPLLSFGLLNGGAATSYADATKNREAYPDYFSVVQTLFNEQAPAIGGKPKALSPACYTKAGEPGPSFMDLKLLGIVIAAIRYLEQHQTAIGTAHQQLLPGLPWIQMVNPVGAPLISGALSSFADSPAGKLSFTLLAEKTSPEFAKKFIAKLCDPLTAVQELLPALALPESDGTYHCFDKAFGETGRVLGLPGGHGMVYATMSTIFKQLYAQGKRFVYLGNIDNLGFFPDPKALAVAALSACDGLFEFSLKTTMDTKGGILVQDEQGQVTCTDIGMAISKSEVKAFEDKGLPILFNCATGLFNLEYLVNNAQNIEQNLPLRVSTQHKDAGHYCQAELSAWEIIGIMKHPVIFGVEKSERFIPAKILLDTFATSLIKMDETNDTTLQTLSRGLHEGMRTVLKQAYGLNM